MMFTANAGAMIVLRKGVRAIGRIIRGTKMRFALSSANLDGATRRRYRNKQEKAGEGGS